ncbi:hypothetical protein C8Q77DRAFT_1269626 [Trametes polyzona]|nr:hypothetical protein C8Q77DRAFT_1269626 [Trametes polyzona]
MGLSGNGSRSDDSQASQLLAAALRPREIQPNSSAPESIHVSDGSSHSNEAHSVHYHMSGIMPTQTQSMYDSEDPAYGEDSQKENALTPVPMEKKISSPPRPSSGNGSPRQVEPASYPSPPQDQLETGKGTKVRPCLAAANQSRDIPRALPSVKGDKAVSFLSPAPPTRLRPRSPKQRRSLSPASQDSFAGPLPEIDYAAAVIAKSKVFDIPLSRLGDESLSISDGEDGPPPVSSNMWASRPLGRGIRQPSPPGKILVEGTPSNSSRSNDSQSQSRSQPQTQPRDSHIFNSQQSDGETQSSDFRPQGQAQYTDDELSELMPVPPMDTDTEGENEPDKSALVPSQQSDITEPSSSYERLVNQDPFSPLPQATQPAHQIAETQAVDYSKPTQEVDATSILQRHDFWQGQQLVFPSVPSESRSADHTRSTIPRGLLGLVAPHKRYRYLATDPSPGPSTQQATGDATADSTAGQAPLDQTLSIEDSAPYMSISTEHTQAPDVSAADISILSAGIKRKLPTAASVLQSLRARQKSPSTGFVPDSEETRIVPDSDPPLPPPLSPVADVPTARSSPTKPPPRRGLLSEDEVLNTVTAGVSAPSVNAIHEEEESEEEDVPLAAAVQSTKAKGKQRAIEPPERGNGAASPAAAKGRKPKSSRKAGPATLLRDSGLAQVDNSWKDAIVPSSDPQERHEDAGARPRSAKPKTPVPQIAPPPPKTRSAPRQAKQAARSRLRESPSDEEEDVNIPEQEDDDHDTQPAEDQMDVDPPQTSTKPTRGGKRKRTVSSSARKNSKGNGGGKTPKVEIETPASRPTKRLKSMSSVRSGKNSEFTRVFALWKQDGHYYSGMVQAQEASGRYAIKFDDGTAGTVDLKFLRACELRPGDHVLCGDARATVVKAPPCGTVGHPSDATVTVDLDEDGEEDVEVQALRLAPRTVAAQWADRALTDDMICPFIKSTPKGTPAPSEGSARAGTARKVLGRTGLVISYTPNYKGEAMHDALVEDVQKHGGIVLENWTALFAMDGAPTPKKGWLLKAADLKWNGRQDVERAYMIADDYHQKAKFLIALALGIPCLSVEWLKKVVASEADEDWQPHLLPAGFSEHLNTRVSQLVDLDWGNSPQHLKEITENLVAAKVFSEMNILCVSSSFVPNRRRGKKAQLSAPETVPHIILCMGASTVEAVGDEKDAVRDLERGYDYVVIPDEKHDASRLYGKCRLVDVNWVKDCLISGRLLPPPKLKRAST